MVYEEVENLRRMREDETLSDRSAHQQSVDEFMRRAGQDVPTVPIMPSPEVRLLRAKLILEEALETIVALGVSVRSVFSGVASADGIPVTPKNVQLKVNPYATPNLVDIVDGCCDVAVVATGTLSACGISDISVQQAINFSNLEKFTGDAHRAPDGKWIKPTGWKPPNLQAIIDTQGRMQSSKEA